MRLQDKPAIPLDPRGLAVFLSDYLGLVSRKVNGLADGKIAAADGVSAAMPTTGSYQKGDFVRNSAPALSGGEFVLGWLRLTDGSAHVAGTDWVACALVSRPNENTHFRLRIVNTAGTLQHRLTSVGDAGVASLDVEAITGASSTLTNTPTGADAVTAFAAGAKIGSAAPSIVWFNTAEQTATQFIGVCNVVYNSSGVALNVGCAVDSLNINGTTRRRLLVQFTNATSGANYDLTTLGSGLIIDCVFRGYLAV